MTLTHPQREWGSERLSCVPKATETKASTEVPPALRTVFLLHPLRLSVAAGVRVLGGTGVIGREEEVRCLCS